MRQHRAFRHRVRLRRYVGVDPRHDIFRRVRAIANGFQNFLFAIQSMRNVLVDLLIRIGDGGPVSAKDHGKIRQRAQPLQRAEIVAHVSFRRID